MHLLRRWAKVGAASAAVAAGLVLAPPSALQPHARRADHEVDHAVPRGVTMTDAERRRLFPHVPEERLAQTDMTDVGRYSAWTPRNLEALGEFFKQYLPDHLRREFALRKEEGRPVRVVDATAGVGTLAMHFLARDWEVEAFEIQQRHCEAVQRNVEAMLGEGGTAGRFKLHCSSFVDALHSDVVEGQELHDARDGAQPASPMHGDVVVIDAPWGGPWVMDQQHSYVYVGLDHMPLDGLLNRTVGARRFKLAVMSLPPNFDFARLHAGLHRELCATVVPVKNYSLCFVWNRRDTHAGHYARAHERQHQQAGQPESHQ